MKLKTLFNEYLNYQRARVSKDWHDLLVSRLNSTWEQLLRKQVEKVRPVDIEKAIFERYKDHNPMPRRMINMELGMLRAVFNFGMKRGYIITNPARALDFLPIEKKERKLLTSEEMKKLIDAAIGMFKPYLTVMKYTLARSRELNNLKWEDIDLENRSIILYTNKTGGRGSRADRLPLRKEAYDVLHELHEKKREGEEYVFGRKKPYAYKIKRLRKLCKKIGIPNIGFHDIRRYGASILASKNIPLRDIQDILRHTDIKNTQLYMKSVEGGLKRAIEALE